MEKTLQINLLNRLNKRYSNKVKKHFLKSYYKAPIAGNLPSIMNKKDFIDYNKLNDYDNYKINKKYNTYLERLSKVYSINDMIKSKVIENKPKLIKHYKKFNLTNDQFNEFLLNYLNERTDQVNSYILRKSLIEKSYNDKVNEIDKDIDNNIYNDINLIPIQLTNNNGRDIINENLNENLHDNLKDTSSDSIIDDSLDLSPLKSSKCVIF